MEGSQRSTLEVLLRQSLEQHAKMKSLMEGLQQQLKLHSLQYVEKYNSALCLLQKETQETDNLLVPLLDLDEIPVYLMDQIAHRSMLQVEILHLVEQAVPKARTVKSILADELQSLKVGASALQGYRHHSDQQGRIIDRTS